MWHLRTWFSGCGYDRLTVGLDYFFCNFNDFYDSTFPKLQWEGIAVSPCALNINVRCKMSNVRSLTRYITEVFDFCFFARWDPHAHLITRKLKSEKLAWGRLFFSVNVYTVCYSFWRNWERTNILVSAIANFRSFVSQKVKENLCESRIVTQNIKKLKSTVLPNLKVCSFLQRGRWWIWLLKFSQKEYILI